MSTTLEADGMRIRIQLTPSLSQDDIVVWSYYTGKRDAAAYTQLFDVVEAHVHRLVNSGDVGLISDFLLGTMYLDEWQNPLFSTNGWGNIAQRALTTTSPATSLLLPPQNAVVISRDTTDDELPVRRRRNRSYLGPIAPGNIGNNGKLVAGLTAELVTEYQTFDTSLGSAPVAASTPPEYDGLCNVSYKGTAVALSPAQIAKTDQIRVGDLVDTQRSRRNGINESYSVGPV